MHYCIILYPVILLVKMIAGNPNLQRLTNRNSEQRNTFRSTYNPLADPLFWNYYDLFSQALKTDNPVSRINIQQRNQNVIPGGKNWDLVNQLLYPPSKLETVLNMPNLDSIDLTSQLFQSVENRNQPRNVRSHDTQRSNRELLSMENPTSDVILLNRLLMRNPSKPITGVTRTLISQPKGPFRSENTIQPFPVGRLGFEFKKPNRSFNTIMSIPRPIRRQVVSPKSNQNRLQNTGIIPDSNIPAATILNNLFSPSELTFMIEKEIQNVIQQSQNNKNLAKDTVGFTVASLPSPTIGSKRNSETIRSSTNFIKTPNDILRTNTENGLSFDGTGQGSTSLRTFESQSNSFNTLADSHLLDVESSSRKAGDNTLIEPSVDSFSSSVGQTLGHHVASTNGSSISMSSGLGSRGLPNANSDSSKSRVFLKANMNPRTSISHGSSTSNAQSVSSEPGALGVQNSNSLSSLGDLRGITNANSMPRLTFGLQNKNSEPGTIRSNIILNSNIDFLSSLPGSSGFSHTESSVLSPHELSNSNFDSMSSMTGSRGFSNGNSNSTSMTSGPSGANTNSNFSALASNGLSNANLVTNILDSSGISNFRSDSMTSKIENFGTEIHTDSSSSRPKNSKLATDQVPDIDTISKNAQLNIFDNGSFSINAQSGEQSFNTDLANILKDANQTGLDIFVHRNSSSTQIGFTLSSGSRNVTNTSSQDGNSKQLIIPNKTFLQRLKILETIYGDLTQMTSNPIALSFLLKADKNGGSSVGDLMTMLASAGNPSPLGGGEEGGLQNALLMSNFLQQEGLANQLPSSNILPLVASSSESKNLLQNPLLSALLLQHTGRQDPGSGSIPLSLSPEMEGLSPVSLSQYSQKFGGSSNIMPTLLAMTGEGMTSPLILQSLLSKQESHSRLPNLMQLLAITGGGESLMENPALLLSLTRPTEPGKRDKVEKENQNPLQSDMLHLMMASE